MEIPSSHHISYIPIACNGQRMKSVCDIHNMWMEVSICDAKFRRETWKAEFYGVVHPASYKRQQGKRKTKIRLEADTKTPSNTGCLIQSWMLHSALRRTMHPLDLQEATLAPTREESCLGIFHLQDFPSTAKITVLFLSGRHECVRSELCFK